SQISKLSVLERIKLVQDILSTISKEAVKESDFEFSITELKEIESRSSSIQNGTAKTTSWDEIESSLKECYGL
ncbi:MAG TPA: hypothetical protein ENK52_04615, partial [Saprospiraceae bacterium]|nr:hypothetical protein [Saprospiraceae bacterium]